MTDDWKAQLGDLGSHEKLKDLGSITDLANAYVKSGDWKQELGDLGTHERIANVGSVKELAERVVNTPTLPKLPESVDGYKVPETVKIKGLRTMALNNKLTQEQLDGVLKFNNEATTTAVNNLRQERLKAVDKLKSEWGDKYDEHLNIAKRAFTHFDDEEGTMNKFLKESRAGDNPTVLRFMHRVGKLLQEDGHFQSDDRTTVKGKSAAARLFPNHPSKT